MISCRNPAYRPVAPLHPQRDPKNPLLVSFSFRAFMFQNMLDGETLRISAQVVACAELADCQQVSCAKNSGIGGQTILNKLSENTSKLGIHSECSVYVLNTTGKY